MFSYPLEAGIPSLPTSSNTPNSDSAHLKPMEFAESDDRTSSEKIRDVFRSAASWLCPTKRKKEESEELLGDEEAQVAPETAEEKKQRIHAAVDQFYRERQAQREKIQQILLRTFFQGGRDQNGMQLTEKDLRPNDPTATDKIVDVVIAVVDQEDGSGKPYYVVEESYLRPVPPTLLKKAAAFAVTGAATLASYKYFDEGILTQALFTPYANLVYEKLLEIYGNPVMFTAAGATAGAYYLNQHFDYSFPTSFAFLTAVAISGLAARRFGKQVSKAGVSGFKATLLPRGMQENDFKSMEGFKSLVERPFKWTVRQIEKCRGIQVEPEQEPYKIFKTLIVEPFVNGELRQADTATVKLEFAHFDNEKFKVIGWNHL